MIQRSAQVRSGFPPSLIISLLVVALTFAVVGLLLFVLYTYSIQIRIGTEQVESVMPGNWYNRGAGTVAPTFWLILVAILLAGLAFSLLIGIIHAESRLMITLAVCFVALLGTVLTAQYKQTTEAALVEFGRAKHSASGRPPKSDVRVRRDAGWTYLPFAFAGLMGVSLVAVGLDLLQRRPSNSTSRTA